MIRWLASLSILVGCIQTNTVRCGADRVCPAGTACDEVHQFCIDPDQAKVCAGMADATECAAVAGTIMGHCLDEVCLASVCGDGVIEFAEMCDDSNTIDDMTCSADCASDLTCGNGVVDPQKQEQCDEGDLLSHDGCSSRCQLETPRWIEHTLTPGGRANAAFAYDSKRGRLVVFSGSRFNATPSTLGETMEWSGADWVRIDTPSEPVGRTDAAMAYDAERGVSVLFGGFDGTWDLSDTWTWDGSEWKVANVGGPIERYGHIMVYDPIRKVIVMFGGWQDDMQQLSDTWEWDGTKWTQIVTPPAATPPRRQWAAAAFDPKRGKIVMTGGYSAEDFPVIDTWTYDGQWHNVTPGGSMPQVAGARLAYDPISQRMLLQGGMNASLVAQAGMWAWDGTSWQSLGNAGGARANPVLAYTGSQLLLFGGSSSSTALDDTYLFNGSVWSLPGDMGGRKQAVCVNDFAEQRAIFYGGFDTNSNTTYGDTWALSTKGLTQIGTPPPTKRNGANMVWDDTHDNALLFGGRDGSAPANAETWLGAMSPTWTWTRKFPGMQPGARAHAGIATDGTQVVMFGGEIADFSDTNETWTWDGTTWDTATTPPTMGARKAPAMAFDPIRRNIVLFGGDTSAVYDDTWLWDATTGWREAKPPFKPTKRSGAELVWNPARKRLTLIGSNTYALDSFEWDGTQWLAIPAENVPVGRVYHTVFTSLDGAGIQMWHGAGGSSSFNAATERWELRWDANHASERCDQQDLDKDGLVGCNDPDCWPVCTPMCMPGAPCDAAAPRCGDGTCTQSRESCRTCPQDCGMCTALCGDYICDQGESGCPGDCGM